VYGPYGVVNKPLIELPSWDTAGRRELKLQTSIEVQPDRGTIPLLITAYGASFDSAAGQVRKAYDDLKKIGTKEGCGFLITHYAPPQKVGEKWRGGGSAEVYTDVAGQDADGRINRANGCFKGLREYLAAQPKDDGKATEAFTVTPPLLPPFERWSVEVLDKHRDALITQANERFKQVQKADARLWDHADVQCTSAGVVTVSEANSHGVTLQLEMLCPVSMAETASDPGTMRKIPK